MIATGFKSCDGCIVPPAEFPMECAKHLIADAKLLYAGEGFSDPQCTYMCATTIQAWAGQFVPEGDIVPPQPKGGTAKQGLTVLQSMVDAGNNAGMQASAFDWKSVLRLVLDVIVKLLTS